ncbi:hypothetical protein [Fulvimarina sp. MAC8]|uniref:hypothetical protein n=1 Tax=Fulvimarina sp. MAC8 TaxID=3162874 RepID=UPI0032EF72B4
MAENPAHLRLKLDTEQPIELSEFVGSFTAIGNQLERYAKERYPDATVEAITYVREVRSGCIEADLSAVIAFAAGHAVNYIDQIVFLEDFVRRWGSRITGLASRKREDEPKTRADFKDFSNAVKAIATDPAATHSLEAATYEEHGERTVRAAFKFTNSDANAALITIEDRKRELEKTDGASHNRVMMIFTRSDIHDAQLDKRSGERVRIEEISDKDLAIMYSSVLAGERIKHEIREAADNVYKKAFVVDVNVRHNANGKPVLYAVTEFHEIIDLPDDD